jgi:hypothetical protein
LVVACSGLPALAQADAPDLVQEGIDRGKSGDHEGAYRALVRAYDQSKSRDGRLLMSLAIACRQTGRDLQALQLLHEMDKAASVTADQTAQARRMHDELYPKFGHIEVEPADAKTIRVDGRAVRVEELPIIDVLAGAHDIDGVSAGRTAHAHVEAPAGVKVIAHLTPSAADVIAPPVDHSKHAPPARLPVVATLGIAAVLSVGTSAVFWGLSKGKASDITSAVKDGASCVTNVRCTELRDADDSRKTLRTVSAITFWSGVGLGVVAVGTRLLWKDVATSSQGALHGIQFGAGPGTIAIRGAF